MIVDILFNDNDYCNLRTQYHYEHMPLEWIQHQCERFEASIEANIWYSSYSDEINKLDSDNKECEKYIVGATLGDGPIKLQQEYENNNNLLSAYFVECLCLYSFNRLYETVDEILSSQINENADIYEEQNLNQTKSEEKTSFLKKMNFCREFPYIEVLTTPDYAPLLSLLKNQGSSIELYNDSQLRPVKSVIYITWANDCHNTLPQKDSDSMHDCSKCNQTTCAFRSPLSKSEPEKTETRVHSYGYNQIFSKPNGLIHLYSGEGKGKTTASIGLAIRSAGHNQNIIFSQFMKGSASGELEILNTIPNITVLRSEKDFPFFSKMTDADKTEITKIHNDIMTNILNKIKSHQADVVILDEITYPLCYGLVDEALVRELLTLKTNRPEIVCTGRNPADFLIEIADYHTIMECHKHPYITNNVKAREGIEY